MTIAKCSCKNAFQDKFYGRGMRVHNGCELEGGKYRSLRCTSCTLEKKRADARSDDKGKGKGKGKKT